MSSKVERSCPVKKVRATVINLDSRCTFLFRIYTVVKYFFAEPHDGLGDGLAIVTSLPLGKHGSLISQE